MAYIHIKQFAGEVPRSSLRLLGDNYAQGAENAKLFSGELRAWKAATETATLAKNGTIKSLYRMEYGGNDFWLHWTDVVDVVRSPVAGVTDGRIYFTGDSSDGGLPKVTKAADATTLGTPALEYPVLTYDLGVPQPTTRITVTPPTGTPPNRNTTRAYVYTYVTGYGEEGPPSEPELATGPITFEVQDDNITFTSATKTIADPDSRLGALGVGDTFVVSGSGSNNGTYTVATAGAGSIVTVEPLLDEAAGQLVSIKNAWLISGLPTTSPTRKNVTAKRIYHTVTGESGTSYFYVAEVDLATATYTDADIDADIVARGIIETTDFAEPPANLHSLVQMPNGIVAGLSDNEICFCEPYKPWAWPVKYRVSIDYIGVGLGVFGNTLAVMTEGTPYLITGIHPEAMVVRRVESYEPCVAKRSIVSTNVGVLYASNNGLIVVNSGGVSNISRGYYTRDEWAELLPSSMYAARYDNRYFVSNGAVGVVLDQGEPQVAVTRVTVNVGSVLWTDPESDKLYSAYLGAVHEWDSSTIDNLDYRWHSKDFILPRPLNFGGIQIEAEFGSTVDLAALLAAIQAANATYIANGTYGDLNAVPINTFAINGSYLQNLDTTGLDYCTVEVFADGILQFSGTPSSRSPMRLPSGFKATRWSIRITGNIPVYSVTVAETLKELQRLV